MTERSDSIVLAEQHVAEARTAALAEFQAARANLRRRVRSPAFIGGLLLGAIALGYLAVGRSKRPVNPRRPGAWSQAVRTAQVLLPLLIAFNSATKPARATRASLGRTTDLDRDHARRPV